MKAVRPIIASNGVPYLQMRSVGTHSTSGMEKKEMKERISHYDNRLGETLQFISTFLNVV